MDFITDWESIISNENTSCLFRRMGNKVHLLISYCEFVDDEKEANERASMADKLVQPENIFPQYLKCENVSTDLISKQVEYDDIIKKYIVSVKWRRLSSPIEGWNCSAFEALKGAE